MIWSWTATSWLWWLEVLLRDGRLLCQNGTDPRDALLCGWHRIPVSRTCLATDGPLAQAQAVIVPQTAPAFVGSESVRDGSNASM